MNVAITPCYGNTSKKATRGKLNIPKKVLNDMGLTEDSNEIILKYDEKKKEITIRKVQKILTNEIEYKTNVKTIEEKNTQKVLEAEKNFKVRLEELINENKEQFNNKLELELGKKELKVQKMQNEIDNLRVQLTVKK